MHLVIDGFGGDAARMWDEHLIRDFLNMCPATLGMTAITEPKVLRYEAPKTEDSGVSGFVIIAESHISIHTFPNRLYVNMDIFSCRPFDQDLALDKAKELFRFREVKTWILDRGLEWLDENGRMASSPDQEMPLETEQPGLRRG
jgi:S-adenosylmethionine decarboxylase